MCTVWHNRKTEKIGKLAIAFFPAKSESERKSERGREKENQSKANQGCNTN